MTPKQYQKRSTDLVRRFKPDKEYTHYFTRHGKEEARGIEFEWLSGLCVHICFSYRSDFARHSDHTFIGLFKLGEETGRAICNDSLSYCWWKWNIHYSGTPAEIRIALLAELEKRLTHAAKVINEKMTITCVTA